MPCDFFSFLVVWAVLLRIMQLTASHPRIGVLINTVVEGWDDFWHFFILFLLLFVGFALIAETLFAPRYHDFESFARTMDTQYHMCLGEVPESFGSDIQLTVYMVVFNFTMFFLVVNFLLAIIVDSYMHVKEDVSANEGEQEFFADLWAGFITNLKRCVHRWPDASEILQKLTVANAKHTIDEDFLRTAFPKWNRTSRKAWLRFYGRFEHLKYIDNKKKKKEPEAEISKSRPITASSRLQGLASVGEAHQELKAAQVAMMNQLSEQQAQFSKINAKLDELRHKSVQLPQSSVAALCILENCPDGEPEELENTFL
eukprot:TRINITY_DN24408_c0_g1_i1.p1 TRINITY_DN24408_c0_g1~~TRINITY_DN24408_c0_g1_i1.p1  ORF type:complete len:314 (+),score=60.60 TRINITY_DN24408_c0_g1_i1:492-1433(+)